MDNRLVLVRHGQSEWNRRNLFTGMEDVPLTERGREEALRAGQLLKAEGMRFDAAYTSLLSRAQDTLSAILRELGQSDLEVIEDYALNERDYGDLVGLNKDDAIARWGEDQVRVWRRSYDVPPPGGESLKDTAARVLPYWSAEILPKVRAGATVIVAAHGNSLRALIMEIESMSPEAVIALNLKTGAPIVYRIGADGRAEDKRDLAA
jgi:2,3-bisphosphoglycerate-dependent phosphoglycerate mutase